MLMVVDAVSERRWFTSVVILTCFFVSFAYIKEQNNGNLFKILYSVQCEHTKQPFIYAVVLSVIYNNAFFATMSSFLLLSLSIRLSFTSFTQASVCWIGLQRHISVCVCADVRANVLHVRVS